MPMMMRHANMAALLAGDRPNRKAPPQSSLPGLTRQSMEKRCFSKWMDARVKPAHDA
jgi:hypothetical protein